MRMRERGASGALLHIRTCESGTLSLGTAECDGLGSEDVPSTG